MEGRHRGDAVSVTSSHSERALRVEDAPWQPVRPPNRGQDRTAFHAFMLLPSLSLSFYAAALGRFRSSISAYRAAAIKATQPDPAIMAAVDAVVWAMRAEHGLQMARIQGSAQLPAWSRLAMGEYRKRGFSRREIAAAFRYRPAPSPMCYKARERLTPYSQASAASPTLSATHPVAGSVTQAVIHVVGLPRSSKLPHPTTGKSHSGFDEQHVGKLPKQSATCD